MQARALRQFGKRQLELTCTLWKPADIKTMKLYQKQLGPT